MRVEVDGFAVEAFLGPPPAMWPEYERRATFSESFDSASPEGTRLSIAAWSRRDREWPTLAVSLRFSPGPEAGFHPGALIAPDADTLFLGAGTQVLAYNLASARRLWVDEADMGFWGWARHADVIVMSAELELAAWDAQGRKLWTTFVEPPWQYVVRAGSIELDVMGRVQTFSLRSGPEGKR